VKEILRHLETAVIEGDGEMAARAAQAAIAAGIPPLVAVEDGASQGMKVIGDRFNKGEVFLPELILAGQAMNDALAVLLSSLPAEEAHGAKRGTVVIGTVKGDVHTIGKTIVAALLTANRFEVHDLGVDVDARQFARKVREVKADIVALSALLTTSMPYQEDVVAYLRDANLRDKCFVIVGGGPVPPEWAEQIGADGYGRTAAHAVDLCMELMASTERPLARPLLLGA